MLIISENPLTKGVYTPAHTYVYQGDFSKILEDIEKGLIPCGSGRPFPVEFNDPNDDLSQMNKGWGDVPDSTYNGGNVIRGFRFG